APKAGNKLDIRSEGFVRHTRIIVTHYGGPDALQGLEEECPEPKEGEVRGRVLGAGVSLPDIMGRGGGHPETPRGAFTPGVDRGGTWLGWWTGSARMYPESNQVRSLPRCRSAAPTRSSSACRNVSWFRCHPGWTPQRLSA